MRLGLFGARADHRGLATLTQTMHAHLRPERTVVVDMGSHSPHACRPEHYPASSEVVAYDTLLADAYDFGRFLDGLDSVVAFETPYSFRLFTEASKRGVHSTLQLMAELDPYIREPHLPRPDVLALPTTWLAGRYPQSPILPVPVARWRAKPGPLVLHPAGTPAMQDRAGTQVFLDAAGADEWWMVRTQVPLPWPIWSPGPMVEIGDLDRPQDVYDGARLVVMPRRYGGLSLPLGETLSAGLPLLTTNAGPYAAQLPPECLVPVAGLRKLNAKGGTIDVHDVDPLVLRAAVDDVLGDEGRQQVMRDAALAWTEAHSWERVGPAWLAALEGAEPKALTGVLRPAAEYGDVYR